MNPNYRNLALWAIIAVLLIALFNLFQTPQQRGSTREVAYSEFLTDLNSGRVRIGYGLLCHATRPTKNGPSRSRWSDVCLVFRIRWTITERGWRSGPRSPTTKSLSSWSSP